MTRSSNIKVCIDSYNIEKASEYKYLGAIIDNKVKFNSFFKSIKQCICSRMITLRKVRYSLETKEALLLYKSKILPYYDIGDLFYDSANADQDRCLQTLQNKCIRIIYGSYSGLSTDVLHKKGNLLKVVPTLSKKNLTASICTEAIF